jgi:transposase InsO family protein
VKFAWIDAEKATWPVTLMCEVFSVSTSGYYVWKAEQRGAEVEEMDLRARICTIHKKSRGVYGSPRIHAELRNMGIRIGRRRVIQIMQEQGLAGRSRLRKVRTTDSRHTHPVAPNLLEQDFNATEPNRKWVGDVTYLRLPDGWLYLAVLLDLHSRQVVGWSTSKKNDRRLALKALDQALTTRQPGPGLVHHTDRGSPYASHDYRERMNEFGMQASMSKAGDC